MIRTSRRRLFALLASATVLIVLATAGRTLAFHLLPVGWTGEADRLAALLQLEPGSVVADIGAGDGEMAVALAGAVGRNGAIYATEITEEQRTEIAEAARAAGATKVRVVAAQARRTGLPDACCDAIYLRTVLHHIDGREAYAHELKRALKPGGRLAVIDFGPGSFLHLAGSHGLAPEQSLAALAPAGFRLERRIDRWGGGLYLLLFRG